MIAIARVGSIVPISSTPTSPSVVGMLELGGRESSRSPNGPVDGDLVTTVNANGVALGVEPFGDDDAPLVVLAGATTMLSWPDELCERYTLRDLAADAAALADALGGGAVHLAGIGVSPADPTVVRGRSRHRQTPRGRTPRFTTSTG